MEFNPEQISHIASAIQSILLSIAILAGGLWTLFTFSVLNLRKKAKAELEALQHRLSFKPLINISVNARSEPNPIDSNFLILATVTIENVGTRDTSIYYPDNRRPFNAVRVDLSNRGDIKFGDRCETGVPFGDTSNDFSQGAIVRAGAKVELPFVTLASSPGVYLASFFAEPTVEDQEHAVAHGSPKTSKVLWSGRSLVVVHKPAEIEHSA